MRAHQTLTLAALAFAPLRSAHAELWALEWARYEGAESCLDAQELSAAVEARLGRAVFSSAERSTLRLDGEVRPEADGFAAKLTVRDARGATLGVREHRLSGSCTQLSEGLVLIVA